MANIYYCQPINRGCGILRAVLSYEEGRSLLKQHSFHYAGPQFPTLVKDQATDFAVLPIFEEELDEEWRAGFYRFDADIMRIEEAVTSLHRNAIPEPMKHLREEGTPCERSRSYYLHGLRHSSRLR